MDDLLTIDIDGLLELEEKRHLCSNCDSVYDPSRSKTQLHGVKSKDSCAMCANKSILKQMGRQDLCTNIVQKLSQATLRDRAYRVLDQCSVTRDEYEFLMPIPFNREQWTSWMKKSIRDYKLALSFNASGYERAVVVSDPIECKLLLLNPTLNDGQYVVSLHSSSLDKFYHARPVDDTQSYLNFKCRQVDGHEIRQLNERIFHEAWDDQKIRDVLTVCETPCDKGFYGLLPIQQKSLLSVGNWILGNKSGSFHDAVPCHKRIVTFTRRHITAIMASHLVFDDTLCWSLLRMWINESSGDTDEMLSVKSDIILDDVRCGIPHSILPLDVDCTSIGDFLSMEMFIRNGGLYGIIRQLQRMSIDTNDDVERTMIWYGMLGAVTKILVCLQSYIAKQFVRNVRNCVKRWVNQRGNQTLNHNEREQIVDYCMGVHVPTKEEWFYSANCTRNDQQLPVTNALSQFLAQYVFPFWKYLPWTSGLTTDCMWMQYCANMTIAHPFVFTILCMFDHPALVAFRPERLSHIESVQRVLYDFVLPDLARIITDYMYVSKVR